MNEQLINGIYNNCKDLILEGVDSTSTETILNSYRTYLIDNYVDTLEEGDDLSKVIDIYTKMEKKRWEGSSLEDKLRSLVKEENYLKLIELSSQGYNQSQKRLNLTTSNQEYIPELTRMQAENFIEEMKQLLEQVQPCNKEQAQVELSEGIMDYMYAANLTDDTSLRIGRMR